jgi:hypothetical protein
MLNDHNWDVFISHATEDKEDFVRPLAHGLTERGLKVWFDDFTLKVGDSLRRSIDRGLAGSRFGIVVISPHFLRKEWPQRELDGLVAREIDGRKVILPVWHNVTAEKIRNCSPTMADKVAVRSSDGLNRVIDELVRAMSPGDTPVRRNTSHLGRRIALKNLAAGRYFRFYHRGQSAIGLKAVFNYGDRAEAALVLAPSGTGVHPGDLLSAYEIEEVIELPDVQIIPMTESATPGAGNIGQPGEIELQGDQLIFVAHSSLRVNLQSGEIDRASGLRPAEIYS